LVPRTAYAVYLESVNWVRFSTVLHLYRLSNDIVGDIGIRCSVVDVENNVVEASIFWLRVGEFAEPSASIIIEASYQLRCRFDSNLHPSG